jgi:hypothetical protein
MAGAEAPPEEGLSLFEFCEIFHLILLGRMPLFWFAPAETGILSK